MGYNNMFFNDQLKLVYALMNLDKICRVCEGRKHRRSCNWESSHHALMNLDEMIAKFVKEENMDEVVIGKVVIMLCCIQMIWYFLQMLYVLHLLYLDIRCG